MQSLILARSNKAILGFPLPPLLRALYTQLANGGFGPMYGLLGLAGGAPGDVYGRLSE